ncbi:hypothetical protein GCM10023222_42540 [Saccharopolyspora cebuensis]
MAGVIRNFRMSTTTPTMVITAFARTAMSDIRHVRIRQAARRSGQREAPVPARGTAWQQESWSGDRRATGCSPAAVGRTGAVYTPTAPAEPGRGRRARGIASPTAADYRPALPNAGTRFPNNGK